MKRITLAMMAIVVSAVVEAQVTPTPPAPRPVPAPRAPEARPPVTPAPRVEPFIFDWDHEWVRDQARHAAEMAREYSRIDAEQIRQATEMAREMSRIDADWIREQSQEVARQAREMARLHVDDWRFEAPRAFEMPMEFHFTPTPMVPPVPPSPAMAPTPSFSFGWGEGLRTQAPQAWAQGDPADSLYRLASESNNRGDYRRAAQLFSELTQKYPRSTYVGEAMYWEAFSRYRLGSTEELQRAATVLETLSARGNEFPRRRSSDSEVDALKLRVWGTLAQRGVRGYDEKVKTLAANGACDKEDVAVRAEALNALGRMDPAAAMPYIRKMLDKKDECSTDLRQKAVFMLGQRASERADGEATTALIAVAKSDPNPSVRSDAISWLPRLPGDAPFAALEDILRSDSDARIQRSAVRALNSSDNPKARQSIRALIDRKDAPEQLRVEAINSFDKERTTDDDAKYLRGLYTRVETDRLRESVVNAVGRIGGTENDQWIISLAKNPNTPDQLRSAAVSRLGRMQTVPIADLIKLYDAAETRSMRDQLINVFANRKEQEATDKLLEIMRNNTTDYIARRNAMNALVRKGQNDPKIMQALLDVMEKKP
jgi:TolA-binding protein/HEAT repeat protein